MPDQKWEKINAIVETSKQGKPAPLDPQPAEALSISLAPIDAQIAEIRSQKMGLIASFKANKIGRDAALARLKELTNAQLEGTRHALHAAVEVEKQRVKVVADKYIFQLTEEYLNDLRVLGLRNYETRMKTLIQLDEVAARLIETLQTKDVPESFKEETLQGIVAKRKEFFNRILEEEARLPQ